MNINFVGFRFSNHNVPANTFLLPRKVTFDGSRISPCCCISKLHGMVTADRLVSAVKIKESLTWMMALPTQFRL